MDTNPIVMSPANWEAYANGIGDYWYHQMGMEASSIQRLYFCGLEFAGEAGELANKIKKIWRDGATTCTIEQAKEELADCQILLRRLARFLGCDVEQECASKTAYNMKRWPQAPIFQIHFGPLV